MGDRPRTGDPAMGARVRLKRRLLGWRQQDLAARSGLTQHFISQVETGSVACSDESRRRIASALDEDEAVILRGAPGVPREVQKLIESFVEPLSANRKEIKILRDLPDEDFEAIGQELAAYVLARLSRLRDPKP